MKKLIAELKLFWLFGIKHNTGLAFHILGGIGFHFIFTNFFGCSIWESRRWVLLIAIGREVLEVIVSRYKYGSWQNALVKTKYKTTKNWFYDSLGDILGAMVGTL